VRLRLRVESGLYGQTAAYFGVFLNPKLPQLPSRLPSTHTQWSGRGLGHSGTSVTEKAYRKQIRPVIQTGAVTMNRIFDDRPPR
jgi:hypothetical protein